MSKSIWMAVTADEYEMVIDLADTARELAEKLGIARNTLLSLHARQTNGSHTGRKIVKVVNDEEEVA